MIADARTLRTLTADPDALLRYLGGLSNAQFQHASAELGGRILAEVHTDCFWSVFGALMRRDRKAYLGTLLKALSARLSPAPGHPWETTANYRASSVTAPLQNCAGK